MSQLEAPIDEVEEALLNSLQLDFDMIRYNEALDKRSTGMMTKHEEALLHKFLIVPNNFWTSPGAPGGRIILWYLPDAISPWIRAEMEEATVGMGYLLKKSMTSGQETKWRTFSRYFHTSDRCPITPGCINIAPCWFQQGQEFPSLMVFHPLVGFCPRGVGYTEGGRRSNSNNIYAVLSAPGLGGSSGDASGVVLGLGSHTDQTHSMGH
ncbi:hypothetical protein DFH29DRAFT_1006832 [Suillus ampliporus]|nr:hypothetical protein DFH29DRAFT_1006832 [Suillus ampliporus]